MEQELNPEEHQFWLLVIQILVHLDLEQLSVVFPIRKIQFKARSHFTPLHFILKISSSCHNQSKVLLYKKTPLTFPLFHFSIKRGIYFMGNWIKLMYARIVRCEAWLIWIKQFVYRQVLKNFVENNFFKHFATNR